MSVIGSLLHKEIFLWDNIHTTFKRFGQACIISVLLFATGRPVRQKYLDMCAYLLNNKTNALLG
jgi:hypothetical protein